MRVVHIIPTYNESENIELFFRTLERVIARDKGRQHLIVVVDDHSPDGTGEIVKRYAGNHKNVCLLSGPKKGLGKAMVRGINYAIEKLHADVIIPTEADFAFNPEYILPALKKIDQGYDVVVGSRHVKRGKTEGWTFNRKFNHWLANTVFASWVAGIAEVKDHNGAFRAVRVKGVQDQINFNGFPTGFGFFCYWIYKLTRVTTKLYELPITYKFRVRGESKVSFNPKYLSSYLKDVKEYVQLAFKIRQERNTINV